MPKKNDQIRSRSQTERTTGSTGESYAADYAFDSKGWLWRRLVELGLRKSATSKKFSFEYIEESLRNAFEAGAKHANESHAPYRALKVMALTPKIRTWLAENDRQALKQLDFAINEADGK